MRYFKGVHCSAPTLAVAGDMGWTACKDRWALSILRYWNRLIAMDESRLTKRIFNWDHHLCNDNWSAFVRNTMSKIGFTNTFRNFSQVNLEQVKQVLSNLANDHWKSEITSKPKLHTYVKF